MMNNYKSKLQNQFNNAQLKSQKLYYQDLYNRISEKLHPANKILEIGAGAGISSIFINHSNIDRTDYLSWEENKLVKGGINAEKMPYPNNSYDVVFGVDVLHHLNSPINALQEISRVLKNGGYAYFIEPYVSPTSYIVYKLFHEEKTTFKYNLSYKHSETDPQDGDQGIAKAIFCTKNGIKMINEKIEDLQNLNLQYLHPLSFYATGGLTRPLKSGKTLISLLLKIGTYIPEIILKLTASRILIRFKVMK